MKASCSRSNLRCVEILRVFSAQFSGTSDESKDLLGRLQSAVTAYARDNVALVTVFIRDPYAAHYVRSEVHTARLVKEFSCSTTLKE